MMKRLFIAFALLLPLAAFGQSSDRDVLLTSDGRLYTVESLFTKADQTQIQSTSYLTLTTQAATGASTTELIPVTLTGGSHGEPALAYDADTKTLFVFWEQAHGLSSDLLFTTYQDGKWGKVTSLDTVDWDLRHNLRIALTRKTEDTAKDGSKISIPEITVHAVWWEEGRESEWARYAMITLDHGEVSATPYVSNLNNILGHVDAAAEKASKNELLRHPAVFESAAHDSVDIVFGDIKTDKMHRVTIHPVVQGRLRIPIGRDRDVATPTAVVASMENVGAVSTSSDNLAYYFAGGDAMKYVVYKDGVWSTLRSIALNEKFSGDAAVNALRRMLTSE
jgi:hypothetical protein